MQENRSADNYFGQLSAQGQPAFEKEPLTGNPDPLHLGTTILPFHKTTLCETADLSHSWNATHQEWDRGAMDGFTAANDINSENSDPSDPSGSRAMGYYDQSDLPFYYSLYNTFATGDRYFASVLGPTFPNRFYLLAATSFGHIENDFPPAGGWQQKTIFDLLGAAGVSWKIYYSQFAFGNFFQYVQDHPDHVAPLSQYYEDAKNGALPAVSFVDPNFVAAAEDDEHPPTNIDLGQQLTYNLVNALEGSPNWTSSAMFLTYDEHGGFYDHVPPPPAAKPDNIAPLLGPNDTHAAFDNYGIRVPAAVISPFSKPHFVSHVVHDHTSILKFIEDRFGLPSLTARDAAADPMLEFFDFTNPAFKTAPSFSAPPVLNCDETPTSTSTSTTTIPGGGATISVSPAAGLTDGATVTVSGSGFDDGPGAVLECNYSPGEPTVTVAGISAPVGCTDPLQTLVNFSGGKVTAQTFVVHAGVIGPPAAGKDSAGNDSAADAALYPCPPTPAQKAAGATCVVALGDLGGHQARQAVTFQSEDTTTSAPSSQTSSPTTTTGQSAVTTGAAVTTTAAHVLGVQVTQPMPSSALSFTGIDAGRLVAAAVGCLLMGILLLAKRREHPAPR